MYTNECIEQVKDVSIETVVSHFVPIDSHHKACCPIHNESTPSFSVNIAKNIFKCFGCGAGGDGISFVQQYRRVTFLEAVEIIAGIAHIDLITEQKYTPEQQIQYLKLREEKKTKLQLLIEAQELYKTELWKNDEVLQYLHEVRRWDYDTIKHWGMGFAPNNNRSLCDQYSNKGLLPLAIGAGLVREKEERCYDVYQNRILFPIHNEKGELISFGGRVLSDKDAKLYGKYKNGYSSDLYNKSKTIFGLDKADKSINELEFAILVEGYADVISMHKAGATNTIATCGTALTEEQARLIKRYTNSIVLMRDGDEAGIKATEKDVRILLAHDFKVEVMALAEKKDPDDYAKTFFIQNKILSNEHELSTAV